jgi:GNAT superfamily N-acetyltransferase
MSTIAVQTGGLVKIFLQQSLGAYTLTDDPARLDLNAMHDYLRRATFCYVCDVYVLEEHRGRGLSKAMLAMAANHVDGR